ncbi:MAG: hypothetical protein ACW99A_13490 [Candidatus Kariarchaeaceae archaeon]|jgi:hypothetical protein
MKKAILIQLTLMVLLFTVSTKGCVVSDDILWVQITSTSWETNGPQIEFHKIENYTSFMFSGVGTFNNPYEKDYEVIHSDGCEWKATIEYSPDSNIQDPLEGINYFPFACTQALVHVDYPSGKTNFNLAGGISFPGELETLPLGFYDIVITLPHSVDSDISSINYLILADGEVLVMRQDKFCGPPPETSENSDETLSAELTIYPISLLLGIFTATTYYRRS